MSNAGEMFSLWWVTGVIIDGELIVGFYNGIAVVAGGDNDWLYER
jgi:hypothetical protein